MPEQPPALAMPAHDRFGSDECQILAATDTEPASQNPQQLVPEAKPSLRSGASRSGQDGQLLAEDQILGDQVGAVTERGLEQAEHEG